jgi:excisionase family DNA binding protein
MGAKTANLAHSPDFQGVDTVSGFDFLTTSEVAALLGVTPGRVKQLLGSGELAGEKLGNAWAISREAVESYLEHRRPIGRPASKSFSS